MRAPLTDHQLGVIAHMRKLAAGSKTCPTALQFAQSWGCTHQGAWKMYVKLVGRGWITRVRRGVYEFVDSPAHVTVSGVPNSVFALGGLGQ